MNKENIDHTDYLMNERIKMLLDHGYYGFKIVNLTFDDHRGQMIIVARNNSGRVLSAYGESKEEACIQLIDLIDITVDTL